MRPYVCDCKPQSGGLPEIVDGVWGCLWCKTFFDEYGERVPRPPVAADADWIDLGEFDGLSLAKGLVA